eukprot:CAMPEP_0114140008 /NCGR_PEP_ID=MMETSP0043_2-20121206/17155_1 /TAXON_ID=464988 /ORGANISM="Hemiselmis andersenii, Strain CCMP644" /LENGTH=232 /DNA_ID=CAMNT_0001234073 /DNA_START=98 /DNA_END=796 /DNA_ORIENTATION=+
MTSSSNSKPHAPPLLQRQSSAPGLRKGGSSSLSRTSHSHPITVSPVSKTGSGRLGLCYCPGKNLVREGIKWERDLDIDLRDMKERHRVDVVVCLLSPAELRSLGVRRDYCESVVKSGMELIMHPIIEMAAPDDIGSARELVERVVGELAKGKRVVMHCRGGMGRAGMMAACVLYRVGEAQGHKAAIEMVRKRRGKGAVESRAQEAFVAKYQQLGVKVGWEGEGPAGDQQEPP